MRISVALSFSALVVAESVGADDGLGYLIVDSRNYFKMPNMLLAAALIAIEYTSMERVLRLLEGRLFRWRRSGLEQRAGTLKPILATHMEWTRSQGNCDAAEHVPDETRRDGGQ
jgi:hypothetical protein